MGFLTDMPTEYRAKNVYGDVAELNRLNGETGKNHVFISTLTTGLTNSVFTCLEKKSAKNSKSSSAGDSTDERKTYLENEQKQILSDLNSKFKIDCKNANEFDGKLNPKFTAITDLQTAISNLDTPIKTLTATIQSKNEELQTKLSQGCTDINVEVNKLNNEIEVTQKKLDEAKKNKLEKEEELKKAQQEYDGIQKLMLQYIKNQKELDKIAGSEISDDTSQIRNFTRALKKWQEAAPNEKSKCAEAADKAYKSMKNIPSSVEYLYHLYDQEIDNDMKKNGNINGSLTNS